MKRIIIAPVMAGALALMAGEAEAAHGRRTAALSDDAWNGTMWISAAGAPVVTLAPGETLVVDFGQNCAAVPSFRFKAAAGTTLTCLPAELLNDGNGAHSRGMDGPEGSVHRRNLRGPDTGMGPAGMNSYNHYAYGVVCEWIWKTVAGIATDAAAPAFRHIIMKPVPDARLGHVKASYRSAAGLIESHWRYEGEKWVWQFTIPQGSTASVTLPGETEAREYAAGTHRVEKVLK